MRQASKFWRGEKTLTPKELALLRALSCDEVRTFLPGCNSTAFDELLSLQMLERCGWIELKVMKRERGPRGRHQPKYAGAAARCIADSGVAECAYSNLRSIFEAYLDLRHLLTGNQKASALRVVLYALYDLVHGHEQAGFQMPCHSSRHGGE